MLTQRPLGSPGGARRPPLMPRAKQKQWGAFGGPTPSNPATDWHTRRKRPVSPAGRLLALEARRGQVVVAVGVGEPLLRLRVVPRRGRGHHGHRGSSPPRHGALPGAWRTRLSSRPAGVHGHAALAPRDLIMGRFKLCAPAAGASTLRIFLNKARTGRSMGEKAVRKSCEYAA